MLDEHDITRAPTYDALADHVRAPSAGLPFVAPQTIAGTTIAHAWPKSAIFSP